jgi:hypothetical protein
MPHDRNGKLLTVGDQVTICAMIKTIHQGEEYCNVMVETAERMYPSIAKTDIALNSRQVEFQEKL